jgi:hypothetical protein
MKYITTLFCFLLTVTLWGKSSGQTNGFAIVVDEKSYAEARNELDAYADALRKDGLEPILLVDRWKRPEGIRDELKRLYNEKNHPLEGAVFVGDIPIAMIRDAQHLTSAFKMDQDRYKWNRSSVPSDRFYDDFDLQFDFLKQDSLQKDFFYYSLKPNSSQRLRPEIYTGRIKPFNTPNKYNDLRAYLKKVVRIREEQNPVDHLLYFGGHGYNSESMMARVDEKISLLEQFPWLKKQQSGIEYIDYSMETFIKGRLLSEMKDDKLDIALLHHHGDTDLELLSAMPQTSGVTEQIEGVKYYLRSKLRSAYDSKKDTLETMQGYMKWLSVPQSWFAGSFDVAVQQRDSVYNYNMDTHIADVQAAHPNARFVILDACFNGSFQLDEYIAGAYLFNDGNTVAVQANSANSLQDKWANELLGLMGQGVRVGQWSRLVGYLETNLLGDPAFHFQAVDPKSDWNQAITTQYANTSYWLKQLESPYPEIQVLSLHLLYANKWSGLPDLLLKTFKESSDGVVRMECLRLLTGYNDDRFLECLMLAIDDSYELIQRQALFLMGKSGNPKLIPSLVKVAMRNNTSDRVNFVTKESLSFFPEKDLLSTFDSLYDKEAHFFNSDSVRIQIRKSISSNATKWIDDVEDLLSPKTSTKLVKSGIRGMRNNTMHLFADQLCQMAKTEKDEYLQRILIEALGWFNISYKKPVIIATCKELLNDPATPASCKIEAQRTLSRLQSDWYR